jgi:RNA polymerase primary sigma factor
VARYHHELLGQFASHCGYTPRKRRLEQLARIRELLASLQPGKTYPYDYVVFQITHFRPDDAPHALFETETLRSDLTTLLLDLTDTLDLPVSWANEPVLPLEGVCRTYDVSLKTVRRWRARGLVALRLVFPDGRKRTAVRQSDLEAFVESHPASIRRTSAYAHIEEETRRRIIARAFELSLSDEVPAAEAVGRIAREFACPHDAVRDLLERYDSDHPEAPIFAPATAPLSQADRRQLLALHRSGRPPIELARQFLVGRSTVGRVVRDLIVQEVLGREWQFIPDPAFQQPGAEQTLLADGPTESTPEGGMIAPLPGEEQTHLFRQYNFLKYQLAKARDETSPSALSPEQLERLARLHDRAVAVRNRLVLANLRLAIFLAARHMTHGATLDELVSEGSVSLMQAIEKFDYTRGVRFSTYASWAILKNFAKTVPRLAEAARAQTEESQEIILHTPDTRTAEGGQREVREVLRSLVTSMLLELAPREREVIVARFGLAGEEAETLEQIGKRYEITRERVRQLEARALRKLATVADPAILEDLALPPAPRL